MKTNEEILNERTEAMNKIQGPRVGDYLRLPYDLYTRFTYDWGDSIQTGGGAGSYHLGSSGYTSYSGGLDSGVKKTDIIQTDETKEGYIWFFDQGISGANRGVDFKISFRVFALREGADISGLPQIKAYEKKLIRDKAEKITRIDGNGNPYTLPIPELFISQKYIKEEVITEIKEKTGIFFVPVPWGYSCQPMRQQQIDNLLNIYDFDSEYYNNAWFSNVLFLKLKS